MILSKKYEQYNIKLKITKIPFVVLLNLLISQTLFSYDITFKDIVGIRDQNKTIETILEDYKKRELKYKKPYIITDEELENLSDETIQKLKENLEYEKYKSFYK